MWRGNKGVGCKREDFLLRDLELKGKVRKDSELAHPVEIYLYCVPLDCGGYVYEGVMADSGSGELSEESALKRLFCAKPGEGRAKAS